MGPRNSRSDCWGSAARVTNTNPAQTSQCTGTSPNWLVSRSKNSLSCWTSASDPSRA